jgi:uncharacterized membrane protein YbhN (UPF0104 family)
LILTPTGRGQKDHGDKRRWLRGIAGVLLLIVVIACAQYFYRKHGADFVAQVEVTWPFIAGLSALILAFQFLGGVRMKLLTAMFGLRLAPVEWIGLAQMTTFFNYLPFKGGAVAGALFLKGSHGFPYTRFLATTAAGSLLAVVTFSATGLLGLVFLWLSSGVFSWTIFGLYLSLVGLPLILFLRLGRATARVRNQHLVRFLEGWRIIRTGGRRLFFLVVVDVCMVLIDALRITLCFGALGIRLNYFAGLVLIPLSNVVGVASLIPGGLGAKEFIMGLLGGGVGMDFTHTIFAATLDRMILLLWVLLLGPVFVTLIFFYHQAPSKKT